MTETRIPAASLHIYVEDVGPTTQGVETWLQVNQPDGAPPAVIIRAALMSVEQLVRVATDHIDDHPYCQTNQQIHAAIADHADTLAGTLAKFDALMPTRHPEQPGAEQTDGYAHLAEQPNIWQRLTEWIKK